MLSCEQVLARLKAAARPDQLEGMAKYGLKKENRLGVSMPNLRALAKEIQRFDSKAARWIASTVIRELDGAAVQSKLKK
jgi:3-methyladenine DNA glycosylase AlkD